MSKWTHTTYKYAFKKMVVGVNFVLKSSCSKLLTVSRELQAKTFYDMSKEIRKKTLFCSNLSLNLRS